MLALTAFNFYRNFTVCAWNSMSNIQKDVRAFPPLEREQNYIYNKKIVYRKDYYQLYIGIELRLKKCFSDISCSDAPHLQKIYSYIPTKMTKKPSSSFFSNPTLIYTSFQLMKLTFFLISYIIQVLTQKVFILINIKLVLLFFLFKHAFKHNSRSCVSVSTLFLQNSSR